MVKMNDFGIGSSPNDLIGGTGLQITESNDNLTFEIEKQKNQSAQPVPELSFGEIYRTVKGSDSITASLFNPMAILRDADPNDVKLPNNYTAEQYNTLIGGLNIKVNQEKVLEIAIDYGWNTALKYKDYLMQREAASLKLAGQSGWSIVGASILAELTDWRAWGVGFGAGAISGGIGFVGSTGLRLSRTGAKALNALNRSRIGRGILYGGLAGGGENLAIEKWRQVYNPDITGEDILVAGAFGTVLGGGFGGVGGKITNVVDNHSIRKKIAELDDLTDRIGAAEAEGNVTDLFILGAIDTMGWDTDEFGAWSSWVKQELAIQKVALLNRLTGESVEIRRTNAEVFADVTNPQVVDIYKNAIATNPALQNQFFDPVYWNDKLPQSFLDAPFEPIVFTRAPIDIEGVSHETAVMRYVDAYDQANESNTLDIFLRKTEWGQGDYENFAVAAMRGFNNIRTPSKADIDKAYDDGVYEAVKSVYGEQGLKMLRLNLLGIYNNFNPNDIFSVMDAVKFTMDLYENSGIRWAEQGAYFKNARRLGKRVNPNIPPTPDDIKAMEIQADALDIEVADYLKQQLNAGEQGGDTAEARSKTIQKALDNDDTVKTMMQEMYGITLNSKNIGTARADLKQLFKNSTDTCGI